jgi:ketosteroid isomerase-like protein
MDRRSPEIEEIVSRETKAWDTKDVDLLLSVFHPDMVWPWPPSNKDHNPEYWVLKLGRFDRKRWGESWQELFNTHNLIRNNRQIKKIVVSNEGDGAFAVLDIDTIWKNKQTEEENRWNGKVCKVFTKMSDGWKLIIHTGVLNYEDFGL